MRLGFIFVYHLSLRAAQGFLSSVVELMKLALPIPDYSTVSRRQDALQVPISALPQGCPRHIVIDATGLRVYGAGEWRVWKHWVGRQRTWRKLHLGVDETTKEIVAVELTRSRVHDSQPLPSLLDQIPDPIGQVSGDGAYDTRPCYEAVLQRQAMPTFVPRRTARAGTAKDATEWRAARNRILQQIAARGRSGWKVLSGYTRQSIAENTMFRFKQLFGGRLCARSLATQLSEAVVKCSVLNRMIDHAGNLLDVRLSETCDLATARAFFRSVRALCKRGPRCVTSDRHGSYPGALRLEFGPTVTHCTRRFANNRLEQDHRAIKQRVRSMQQFKRFDSAARFCLAQNEVQHFFRFPPPGRRPAPLRWQRRLRHQQFTMLQKMLLAA
jgi:hypothetical protein